jgi:hypothetical protein
MARFHILKDVSTEQIHLQHFLWMGIPHLPVSGFFSSPLWSPLAWREKALGDDHIQ